MLIHEAHQRGVTHLIVTHATNLVVDMTVPQMQQATRDGAFIELDAGGPLGAKPMHTYPYYADVIRQVGAKFCILVTDFGSVSNPPRPLHPQGLLDFMNALHAQGISVEDLNLMTKTNPALELGLTP